MAKIALGAARAEERSGAMVKMAIPRFFLANDPEDVLVFVSR